MMESEMKRADSERRRFEFSFISWPLSINGWAEVRRLSCWGKGKVWRFRPWAVLRESIIFSLKRSWGERVSLSNAGVPFSIEAR